MSENLTMTEHKIGIGYDIHKLVPGRKLILGGVEISHDKGLLGHSDGDALLHAIADALLGAAGLGDIGKHFPDTDPEFKDADSKKILSQVVELVRKTGFGPQNIDSNIIAQSPKLAPYIGSMRECISSILKMPMESVSVKARTNEGLDAVGRGEAIATQAIVLIKELNGLSS